MLVAHSLKPFMRQDQLEFDAAMYVYMLPEGVCIGQGHERLSMFFCISRADVLFLTD